MFFEGYCLHAPLWGLFFFFLTETGTWEMMGSGVIQLVMQGWSVCAGWTLSSHFRVLLPAAT